MRFRRHRFQTDPLPSHRNRTEYHSLPPPRFPHLPLLSPRIYRWICVRILNDRGTFPASIFAETERIKTFPRMILNERNLPKFAKTSFSTRITEDENIKNFLKFPLLNAYGFLLRGSRKIPKRTKYIGSSLNRSFVREREESIDKKINETMEGSFQPNPNDPNELPVERFASNASLHCALETGARVALFNWCIIRSSRQIERREASKAQLV